MGEIEEMQKAEWNYEQVKTTVLLANLKTPQLLSDGLSDVGVTEARRNKCWAELMGEHERATLSTT